MHAYAHEPRHLLVAYSTDLAPPERHRLHGEPLQHRRPVPDHGRH